MKYKRCEQNRHDCFGCDCDGKCVVLNNTIFKRRNGTTYKCPFYKTVMQAGTNAETLKETDVYDEDTSAELGV